MLCHIGCVVMIFGVGLLCGAIVLEVIHATQVKVVAQAHNCSQARNRGNSKECLATQC